MYRDDRESRWDETFDLAIYVMETDPSTCILLNLLRRDTGEHLAGGTLYLYEMHPEGRLRFRQGTYKLRLWPGRPAECPPDPDDCSTDAIPTYGEVCEEFKKLDIVEKVGDVRLWRTLPSC